MKTFYGYLSLYLKAAWWATTILAGTVLGAAIIFHPTGEALVPFWYPILFAQSVILAIRFLPVDRLLFTVGVTPRRRMAVMFTAWVLHLTIVAISLAFSAYLAGVPMSPFIQRSYRQLSASDLNFIFFYCTLGLIFGSALLWVDLQARRLANMGPFDSAVFMIIGQVCMLFFVYRLGHFVSIRSGSGQPDINLFLVTAGVFVLVHLIVSRLISTHSLLKNSEVA